MKRLWSTIIPKNFELIAASPMVLAPLYCWWTETSPFATGLLMTKVVMGSGLVAAALVATMLKRGGDISTQGWHWIGALLTVGGFGISCFLGWKGLFWFALWRSAAVQSVIHSFF